MAARSTAVPCVVPDLLHHTFLAVDEHNIETTEDIPRVYVLGTHATIEAAKNFAASVIPTLGYNKVDFETYQERRRDAEEWEHGDSTIVYAKAPAGQEFFVGIDTKLNTEKLRASPEESIVLPHGVGHLHYILQTTIDYRVDRRVSTEIHGAYLRRSDALEAAKWCLLVGGGTDADFAQFDARSDLGMREDWPFGEDILVHAVAFTGENYLVAMRTPPSAYLRHSKRSKKHTE